MVGNNVSHANNKTKRRFLPNLHYRRFWMDTENRWVRLRISNAALRLIDKVGIEQVVADLRKRGVRDAQAHPAVLGFHPEPAVMQVRQETTFGIVVGVGNIVPHHRALTRDLTDACHDASPVNYWPRIPAKTTIIARF